MLVGMAVWDQFNNKPSEFNLKFRSRVATLAFHGFYKRNAVAAALTLQAKVRFGAYVKYLQDDYTNPRFWNIMKHIQLSPRSLTLLNMSSSCIYCDTNLTVFRYERYQSTVVVTISNTTVVTLERQTNGKIGIEWWYKCWAWWTQMLYEPWQ